MRGVRTLEVLNLFLKGLADFVHLKGKFSFSLNLALHLFKLHILTSLEVLRLLQLLLDVINLSSTLKRSGQRGKKKRGHERGGGEGVVPLGLVDLVFCVDLIL